MVSVSGCSNLDDFPKPDPFLSLYTQKTESLSGNNVPADKMKGFDFSASEMPFAVFIRWFADTTGRGVIYSSDVDSCLITAEFRGSSADEIMSGVCRRVGVELVKLNNTYYCGRLKPEDRGYLVRKIKGYSDKEITSAVTVFLSEFGKCFVSTDGLTLVSDRESILTSVNSVIDAMHSSAGETWITQFYIVSVKKKLYIQGGADVQSSGQVAYMLSKGENPEFNYNDIGQQLNLVLNTNSDYVDLKAAPMMLLRDGTGAEWQDGRTVPVPKKSVSQYGVVTTEGYENVETGLILKIKLRESRLGAYLSIEFIDSRIESYVESAPVLAKSSLKGESEIESGGIFLIGELHKKEDSQGFQKVLNMSSDEGGTKIQIWVRAYKIAGKSLTNPM